MGAELEKQAQTFRIERDRLTNHIRAEEERRIDVELQFKSLKTEVRLLQLSIYSSKF